MDHRKYGHFIIHDSKTIIEFKHGNIVIFPSALLKYENSPLADNISHRSVICYITGGLPRWISQGHAKDTTLMEIEKDLLTEGHCVLGYGLYPTVKDLQDATNDKKHFMGTAVPLIESLKLPEEAPKYDRQQKQKHN
jgi:hypothetical protein